MYALWIIPSNSFWRGRKCWKIPLFLRNRRLISEGVYIKVAVWGICFAKPCGTLGKKQRIKLSWGKLANSSKHSLLDSVGTTAGEGYHGYSTRVQAVTLLKKLYFSHGRHESHGSLVAVFRPLAIYWNVGVSAQTTEGSLSWKSVPKREDTIKHETRLFSRVFYRRSAFNIQSTPGNSNPLYNSILPLTRGNFHFPSGQFSI